jgi:hypothetical protein
MTHGVGGAHIWQSVMVDIGFRHHFLLHSILAVAAVHKAIIFPAERDELITQSSAHIDIAITSFRDLLESPLPATCVPVFLTAGLLSIHSLGMAQSRTPTDPVADIYTFMRLVKGTQSTIQQNWPILQTSEIAPLLTIPHATPADTVIEEVDALKSLVQAEVDMDDSIRTTYLETIHQLQIVFSNVRRLAEDNFQASSQLSSWVALVPPEYHELLASREPVALVILAYFAVLFKMQPHVWWFRNWGGWILESVRGQLPGRYDGWLEWPASQIGGG